MYAQRKPAPEYQVKAAFLYNFTRFIDWPSVAFSSPDAPFVIGIVGNDPFGSCLEEIVEGEKVDDHRIIVQHYPGWKDISDCQILFINLKDAIKVKEVLSAVSHDNVLTVGDSYGFSKWGGIIRFYKEGNKIRFQINIASAKAVKLEISSKLLSVGSIY